MQIPSSLAISCESSSESKLRAATLFLKVREEARLVRSTPSLSSISSPLPINTEVIQRRMQADFIFNRSTSFEVQLAVTGGIHAGTDLSIAIDIQIIAHGTSLDFVKVAFRSLKLIII
mmetsp:Transcript_20854/g.29876  ORF Transcript_20854/g.29876 Transcript_20854/m.29876 type:complete len:118 (-) Transcript_20854:265-618(-)